MKKNYLTHFNLTKCFRFFLILAIVGFFGITNSSATHLAGGNITYSCASGNTYNVKVTIYRDCKGISLSNPSLTIKGCGNTFTVNYSGPAVTPILVTPPCNANVLTACNGGTAPGIQRYDYNFTYTLPAALVTCSDVVFSYDVAARNNAITTLNNAGGQNMYLEAHLNPIVAPCNTSPNFNIDPILFLCLNQTNCFNFGATEPNGDSITYEFMSPRQAGGALVAYNAGFDSTHSITGTQTLSGVTGDICLTPSTAGQVGVMAVKVTERRLINGVWTVVGSVMRDIQMYMVACTNNLPTLTGVDSTTNFTITGCAGSQICFNVYSNDIDTANTTTVSVSSGVPPGTFTVTPGKRGFGRYCLNTTLADAGKTYSFVLAAQDNACPQNGQQTYTYQVKVTGLTATATATSPKCYGGNNGEATITANGTGPFSYSWNTNPVQHTATATGLSSGTYCATATTGGCSVTECVTISIPQPLVASSSSTPVSCFGGANGTATITSVTNGVAPFNYYWSPGSKTGQTISGLTQGTYCATIIDANGCTTSKCQEITQPTKLDASLANLKDVACTQLGSFDIVANGGTPGYTYLTNSNPAQTSASVINLVQGTYAVTVRDANGCRASLTATIAGSSAITASETHTNPVCHGDKTGTATITASGSSGYTYNWTPNVSNSNVATGLAAGTYNVDVIAGSCSASVTVIITEPTALAATESHNDLSCNGTSDGSITLSVSGGTGAYSYYWNPNVSNSNTATGLGAGSYVVTISDGNYCTLTKKITIAEPAALDVSENHIDVNCCHGDNGAIILAVTGGTGPYTYDWNPNVSNSSSATGLTTGTYSVTISDAKGCSTSKTVVITKPVPLKATVSTTDVTCNGGQNGTITLTVTGGTAPYVYIWTPNVSSTNTASGLAAGTYTVTIQDSKCCVITKTIVINEADLLDVSENHIDINCCHGNNGQIILAVSGGTAPYTYDWNPNVSTSSSATGLTSGTYVVVITDANGCSATKTIVVGKPVPLKVVIDQTNVGCNGLNDGTITLTVSGGTAPYFYVWNPSVSSSNTATGLSPGTYTVTIQDSKCCTVTKTIVITGSAPLILAEAHENLACCNYSTGTIILAVSGGTTPYTYVWSPSVSTSATATGLSAGTYSVIVTDAKGCSISKTIEITQPTLLVINETHTNVSCHGSNNGSIQLSVTGGTGGYKYYWNPNVSNGSSASNLAAGTYTINVVDDNGCAASITVVLTESNDLQVSETHTNLTCGCHSGGNGSIDLTVSGGSGTYTYDWTPNVSNSASANGLNAGTYTIVVTDAYGCSKTITVELTQPAILEVDETHTNVTCHGGDDGSISLIVTGGTGNLSYDWTPNVSNGSTANNLTAGTYSVIVTDANGCSASKTVVITEPKELKITETHSHITCGCHSGGNGSIDLSVSGGTPSYTYNWTPNVSHSASANGLDAGTYTIVVTDANGCSKTIVIELTQPQILEVTETHTNVSCNGGDNGSISLTVTGGSGNFSYHWTPNVSNGSTASGLGAGTYSVTVTDRNGCSASETIVITEPKELKISETHTHITCGCHSGGNGSIDLSVSGGTPSYTYKWTPNVSHSASANGLDAGTYSITVTDSKGCSKTIVVELTQPQILEVTETHTNVNCNGGDNGSISLTVTGGSGNLNYHWTPNVSNSSTASGLGAGTYSVTVTDKNGCSASETIVITEPKELKVTETHTNLTCGCHSGGNGSIDLSVSGGTPSYTYKWTPNVSHTASANGLDAGTYSIVITDSKGCSATKTVVITQPDILSLDETHTNVSCYGGNNGSIAITIIGGNGSHTFKWTPNVSNSATASGLGAGTYTVTVTDKNGCSASETVVITQPTELKVTETHTNLTCGCHSGGNGSISLSVSGGTPSYTYKWTPNVSNSSSANGLDAGTYSIVITDSKGCSATKSVVITQPAILSLDETHTNVSCNGGSNGSIAITVIGGNGSSTYKWTPNVSNSATASGLGAGTYTVTVTDKNGCSASETIVITQPTELKVTETHTNLNCGCNSGGNGSISLSVSGGTPSYTYKWTPNVSNSSSANGLNAGTYSVVITDSKGCSVSKSIVITQPPILSLNETHTNLSCNGGNNGSISISVVGGTGPFTYKWTPNVSSSSTASGLGAGNYSVTVTDKNGCTTSKTVTITQPSAIVITESHVNPAPTCTCGSSGKGSITLSVSGGTPGYTYSWSNGAKTQNLSNLGTGNYTVTVKDKNGCSVSKTITLSNGPALSVSICKSNASCKTVCDGTATATASGGVGPYTYKWSNGAKTAKITCLCKGNYTVTVTDANGCTTTQTITIGYGNSCGCKIADEIISATATTPIIHVFPNPATDIVSIGFTGITDEIKVHSELFDISGTRILLQSDESYFPDYLNSMNLGNLATGVYILRVQFGDEIQSVRIVKQ